jgi:hypothetical protein
MNCFYLVTYRAVQTFYVDMSSRHPKICTVPGYGERVHVGRQRIAEHAEDGGQSQVQGHLHSFFWCLSGLEIVRK